MRDGRTRTHRLWYVLPQARGPGLSGMAQGFPIRAARRGPPGPSRMG
ncbi:DUF1810 family protein [Blastococcus sp. CT_GayMR19]|nr:DUF1810 family protein [Blastococcus sp. CT_GayMR19]